MKGVTKKAMHSLFHLLREISYFPCCRHPAPDENQSSKNFIVIFCTMGACCVHGCVLLHISTVQALNYHKVLSQD